MRRSLSRSVAFIRLPTARGFHPRRRLRGRQRGALESILALLCAAGSSSVLPGAPPHRARGLYWRRSEAPDAALQDDHRAVPDQVGRVGQVHESRGTREGAGAGGLQRLPAARRGRADRSLDRLRHRRHVRGPVGRHHAGRRDLRGQPLLLPLPRRGPGPHRLPPRHPDAPGSRGGADPVSHGVEAGRRRPEQQPLRHDARQRGGRGSGGARPRDPGGPGALAGAPVQGQHRPRRARADARGGRRPRAARDGDGDQQHRRRAAGLAREPARGEKALRPLPEALLPRRLSFRGERLLHQDARAGTGGAHAEGNRPRDVLARRRLHHVGQEGRPRQHRRLPGA